MVQQVPQQSQQSQAQPAQSGQNYQSQPNQPSQRSPQSQQASMASAQPPHQPDSMQPTTMKFAEPWSGFFAKAPVQPKVILTYMELGIDLGGQSDKKRGAVLRNVLNNHLQWPKGTTAFWPVAALSHGTLQPDNAMFWKGWEIWKTPYIACFGEEALKIIHPQAEPGNTTYLLEHVTIYVLPPMTTLISMLPHEQQMSIGLLSSIRF